MQLTVTSGIPLCADLMQRLQQGLQHFEVLQSLDIFGSGLRLGSSGHYVCSYSDTSQIGSGMEVYCTAQISCQSPLPTTSAKYLNAVPNSIGYVPLVVSSCGVLLWCRCLVSCSIAPMPPAAIAWRRVRN